MDANCSHNLQKTVHNFGAVRKMSVKNLLLVLVFNVKLYS